MFLQIDTKIFKLIEEELLTLVDELMFTSFADALPTTTDNEWISLVTGGLQMWLAEQQQIALPNTLLVERVLSITEELITMEKSFSADGLKDFVHTKYEMMTDEDKVQLISERFRQFVGNEYIKLIGGSGWTKDPSEEDIIELVKKVLTLAKVQDIKLANEEMAKISEIVPTDVLDPEQMELMSQQLLKFSENEFEAYVVETMTQLEKFGVDEVEMNMVYQLYLLVKQELFSMIAKTVLKSTSKERIDITTDGVSKIFSGQQLIDDDSVFGQIFVLLATGTAVLKEDKTVTAVDDVLLRTFVKNEFDDLKSDDVLKLTNEAYLKFIIDEFIKLVSEIDVAKNDAGELLLKNVIDLIATQFLLFAEDEMTTLAQRLAKLVEEETDKVETVIEQLKVQLTLYDEAKLLKLIQFVKQELFTIVMKSLVNFTETNFIELAEEGLSKLLADDKPIGKSSILQRIFAAFGDNLSKLTTDEFAAFEDDELQQMVRLEFEKENYEKNAELFEEVYMTLIAQEFVEMIGEEAVLVSATDGENHPFGEMVRYLADQLHSIESIY